MYRNLVAAVLALNGLILLAIGAAIALSTGAQMEDLGLDAEQTLRISPTFYGLGMADAASSLYSLLAAFWIYRGQASGRTLALVVAAYQLIVGVGVFAVTGLPFALYVITSRGVLIGALAWWLPTAEE